MVCSATVQLSVILFLLFITVWQGVGGMVPGNTTIPSPATKPCVRPKAITFRNCIASRLLLECFCPLDDRNVTFRRVQVPCVKGNYNTKDPCSKVGGGGVAASLNNVTSLTKPQNTSILLVTYKECMRDTIIISITAMTVVILPLLVIAAWFLVTKCIVGRSNKDNVVAVQSIEKPNMINRSGLKDDLVLYDDVGNSGKINNCIIC